MPAPAKRDALNLRIKPEERSLIDRAAKAQGKTRTDFILEAARHAAEEAILDRVVLTAEPGAYAEFLARLDAPPRAERSPPPDDAERCSVGRGVKVAAPTLLTSDHDVDTFACGVAIHRRSTH